MPRPKGYVRQGLLYVLAGITFSAFVHSTYIFVAIRSLPASQVFVLQRYVCLPEFTRKLSGCLICFTLIILEPRSCYSCQLRMESSFYLGLKNSHAVVSMNLIIVVN